VGDAQHYRSKEELAAVKEKCPIERLKRLLVQQGVAPAELESLAQRATAEVQQAVDGARAAPRPHPATVLDDVYRSPALHGTAG
jgi:pyruvate dehydrogenase E1 component alpha subunit